MNYFCTLFDSFYLSRGLVMYRSLKEQCPDFHLYIFAFDTTAYQLLTDMQLENITLISLSEFEDEQLLTVKKDRTKAEYCWTCTPATIVYCLAKFNLPQCTYIDADLFFYRNPSVLNDEMGENNSILITEHRYTSKYDQSATSGIYCVQFVTFRNNEHGRMALFWWRDRCLEWCYARFEDGKFGDQAYLDDWPQRFKGVYVLQHLGGGLAPWNLQQYRLHNQKQGWMLTEICTKKAYPVIFFHFHYVKFYSDGTIDLSDIYDLNSTGALGLYKEYIRRMGDIDEELLQSFNFKPRKLDRPPNSLIYKFGKKIYNRYQRLYGLHNNISMKAFINSTFY